MLAHYTYLIGNSSDFSLCLCENWDDHDPIRTGYSKKMSLPLRKTGDAIKVDPELRFSLREMLPALFEKRSEPKAFYFSPVNFYERCFGYAVYSGSDARSYPGCYCKWVRYVSASLENLRRRRDLMHMQRKIEENAVTDLLTGIYNRNGFSLYSKKMFDSAKENGGFISIIVGNINNLKYINDTFGLAEGDFAVKSSADAVRSACGKGMLCFRTNGDEFVIISSSAASEDNISETTGRISEYLRKVNEAADKPYSISMSIGTFFGPAAGFSSVEQPFSIADSRMFAAKEKFKRDEGFDYRKMRSAK